MEPKRGANQNIMAGGGPKVRRSGRTSGDQPVSAARAAGLAISIRQPWAWAVVHAGKDVENRGPHAPRLFQAAVGQRVYIHASKSMITAEWLDASAFMASIGVKCPSPSGLLYGGIIGSVL